MGASGGIHVTYMGENSPSHTVRPALLRNAAADGAQSNRQTCARKEKFPLVYKLKRIPVHQANKENESRHGFLKKTYGVGIKIRNKFISM